MGIEGERTAHTFLTNGYRYSGRWLRNLSAFGTTLDINGLFL